MNEPERAERFVALLTQHQRAVGAYVLTLVPNWTDAEEILQETNVVLWREFDKFVEGTNFLAWACRVAFHQVLAFRKRKKREKLEFSEAFLDAVANEAVEVGEHLESRHGAMTRCIEKLDDAHRELLRRRYRDADSIEQLAEHSQRTVGAVYRLLSRIRRSLHDCITRTLAAEARS